jgi:hypothetical protein
LSADEIDFEVQDYVSDYFRDIKEVVKFQERQIENNELELESPVDYVRLFPFLSQTIQTISRNDQAVLLGVLKTIFDEVTELHALYLKFVKEHNQKTALKRESMITHMTLKGILSENDKNDKDIMKHLASTFKKYFEEEYKEYGNKLRNIIQIKAYYIDKTFWSNARKNVHISDYFDKVSNMKKLNLKSYIQYYLKRASKQTLKDPLWTDFLITTYKQL